MDQAVAVVEAYLRINGYLTVAECPVLEEGHRGPAQSVTDLDILAVRFAVPRAPAAELHAGPDPMLGGDPDLPDMIIGEVKEGRPRLNHALREPRALGAALIRFGCCRPEEADEVVERLIRHGEVIAPAGHMVRVIAFGNPHGSAPGGVGRMVPLDHVVEYLREHLRAHWDQVAHSQIKDPVLGMFALLEKSERAARRSR